MLKPEQGDERDINNDSGGGRSRRPAVNRDRSKGKVANEDDQVQEGREEDRISEDSEEHGCDA